MRPGRRCCGTKLKVSHEKPLVVSLGPCDYRGARNKSVLRSRLNHANYSWYILFCIICTKRCENNKSEKPPARAYTQQTLVGDIIVPGSTGRRLQQRQVKKGKTSSWWTLRLLLTISIILCDTSQARIMFQKFARQKVFWTFKNAYLGICVRYFFLRNFQRQNCTLQILCRWIRQRCIFIPPVYLYLLYF